MKFILLSFLLFSTLFSNEFENKFINFIIDKQQTSRSFIDKKVFHSCDMLSQINSNLISVGSSKLSLSEVSLLVTYLKNVSSDTLCPNPNTYFYLIGNEFETEKYLFRRLFLNNKFSLLLNNNSISNKPILDYDFLSKVFTLKKLRPIAISYISYGEIYIAYEKIK